MILNCTINVDKMLTLILLGLILFSCGVHGITAEYDPHYIKLVEVEAGVKGCFLCDNKFELEGDIEWFFNGSLINATSDPRMELTNLADEKNALLFINYLLTSDTGVYHCNIGSTKGDVLWIYYLKEWDDTAPNVLLSVYGHQPMPEILAKNEPLNSSLIVNRNQEIQLICWIPELYKDTRSPHQNLYGRPMSMLSWTGMEGLNATIRDGNRGQILQINGLGGKMQWKLTCKAAYWHKEVVETSILLILGSSESPVESSEQLLIKSNTNTESPQNPDSSNLSMLSSVFVLMTLLFIVGYFIYRVKNKRIKPVHELPPPATTALASNTKSVDWKEIQLN